MIAKADTIRELKPGSNGWTCEDLDAPGVREQWEREHVELVHGVIAEIPALHFAHGQPLAKLAYLLTLHFEENAVDAEVGVGEVDLQVAPDTRCRVDGLVLTAADKLRQERRQAQLRPGEHPPGVIVVPPSVVIESISLGHEKHDRVTKFADYARFGVPNYWIVDAYKRSIQCMVLQGGQYVEDVAGVGEDVLRPSAFPGLTLPLKKVFT
jgi:hypothetical protein